MGRIYRGVNHENPASRRTRHRSGISPRSGQSVSSPDGRIRFEILPGAQYRVTLNQQAIIEPSSLGIIVDGLNLASDAKPGKATLGKTRQEFAWFGNTPKVSAECRTLSLPFQATTRFTVEAWACNDGVAFRYLVPGGGHRIPDESTTFRLPAGATVWYHDLEGHYEAIHAEKRIEDIGAGDWAAPPVTFRTAPGAYASITEGAVARYAGMALQADGKAAFSARLGHTHPPSYPFRLRYKDDIERVSKPASIHGPITTPWRVVMIGQDLNALVNSNIIGIVAEPSRIAGPSWIRPGRAVWKYLDGGENTIETVREFSRLAGQLGFEYQVVEGFWQKWPKGDLKAVIEESRRQGVGLWLWKHSNQLRTPESRKAFFDMCAEVGAAGVKIDFFDHEAKEVVELYELYLQDAASRKLLVNFHGANKPSGELRTWPNELTREAVRGMESSKALRARHGATIPFTRLLAGPADYTPLHFGPRRNDTTWAHQIATAIIFSSPLQTYAAHPASILSNPAVELIKSIPAVWDETRVLDGSEIGKAAVFARRKGTDWFVAVVNGDEPRTLKINLDFLGKGSHNALLVRDKEGERGAVDIETGIASTIDVLTLNLQPGGGWSARFSR